MNVKEFQFDSEHLICIVQHSDIEQPVAYFSSIQKRIIPFDGYSFPLEDCYLCAKDLSHINEIPITLRSADDDLKLIETSDKWFLMAYSDESTVITWFKCFIIDENSSIINIFKENVQINKESGKKLLLKTRSHLFLKVGYYNFGINEHIEYLIDFKENIYYKLEPVLSTHDNSYWGRYYKIVEKYDEKGILVLRNFARITLISGSYYFTYWFPPAKYTIIDAFVTNVSLDVLAKDEYGNYLLAYMDVKKEEFKGQYINYGADCEIYRLKRSYDRTIEVLPVFIHCYKNKKRLIHKNIIAASEYNDISYFHNNPEYIRLAIHHPDYVSFDLKDIFFYGDNKIFDIDGNLIIDLSITQIYDKHILQNRLHIKKGVALLDTFDNLIAFVDGDCIRLLEFSKSNKDKNLEIKVPVQTLRKLNDKIFISIRIDLREINRCHCDFGSIPGVLYLNLENMKFEIFPEFLEAMRNYDMWYGVHGHDNIGYAFEDDAELYNNYLLD